MPAAAARGSTTSRTSSKRWRTSTGCRRTRPKCSTSSASCIRASIARRRHRDHRELDVGDPGVAIYRGSRRAARCLVAHPVNPPHLVPVVELCGAPWTDAGDDRARARGDDGDRPGADHRQARARRLHPQSIAGRAAVRGAAPRRRGLRVAARPRQDDAGRPRAALVVHRPVRDDRAQRAGRRRRLLRALCWVLSLARGESAFGCRLGYCERAAASRASSNRRRREPDATRGCAGAICACWRCAQHKRDEPDSN